jgi:hypothetical protein
MKGSTRTGRWAIHCDDARLSPSPRSGKGFLSGRTIGQALADDVAADDGGDFQRGVFVESELITEGDDHATDHGSPEFAGFEFFEHVGISNYLEEFEFFPKAQPQVWGLGLWFAKKGHVFQTGVIFSLPVGPSTTVQLEREMTAEIRRKRSAFMGY